MTRNINTELIRTLGQVDFFGEEIEVRGSLTKEILNFQVDIERPWERCLFLRHRNDNIFAKIAETLWVLSGRNDMEFLSHYLPRAPEWSDDGKVWRGGYGPRLRQWEGLGNDLGHISKLATNYVISDQFENVINLLSKDPNSRQAVMVIFDPAKDYVESKDIPCNNWLHWTIRNNKLNLSVAIRSQDALWGFSGINSFEWSVLMEFMAHWLGVEVGTYHQHVTSFHVYERHFQRMQDIRFQAWVNTGMHVMPTFPRLKISVPFFDSEDNEMPEFDRLMNYIFDVERHMRGEPSGIVKDYSKAYDEFLDACLDMLWVYNFWIADEIAQKYKISKILEIVNEMPYCEFKVAAVEYFCRKGKLSIDEFDIPADAKTFLVDWVL